ncbi:MAG: amidohydrolase family protein [Planctomycetota bacterium]|nr:amidohydrolase family protein [Planctomycetota bacterium]
MNIDAHQHFWQVEQPAPFDYAWLNKSEMEPIRRSFLPEDLLPHLKSVGIEQSIFVQTQHTLEENRWVLQLADQHAFIAGVVGWVDLANEACEDQLLEFNQHPKFVGVRHVTQDEPDDDFIIRPAVLRGLKALEKHGVPFDLLFYVKHLKHATTVARHVPELPLLIDHLAKPRIKDRAMADWVDNFRAAAKLPNVYCKLSGLVTEADWTTWSASDLQPYIQIALDEFGPARCMYGSDWPVCKLAGSYEQVHGALVECVKSLSDSEQDRIFSGTAREFYRLES